MKVSDRDRNVKGKNVRCVKLIVIFTYNVTLLKAKFQYASWFRAGSEPVRSWFEPEFGLSSSLL